MPTNEPEEMPWKRLNLPQQVRFCRKCVVSNQRPSSTVEFKNDNRKELIHFDDEGVCAACRYHEMRWNQTDWVARARALEELCDRHRSRDGSYDVVVPGSGGKDSMYVSHILKTRYGMHPLTVTWPPHLYTEIGRRNFEAWLNTGLDNITFHPNPSVHRRLTREAFLNLLHPFQPFVLGQKQIGPKFALQYKIKLIMYGESQAEGGTNMAEGMRPTMNPAYYSLPRSERTNIKLAGRPYDELLSAGFSEFDLLPYLPVSREDVDQAGLEVHHMGFYEHWRPQEKFYYAAEHCGFQPNPVRTEGTYSKYASLDDKIDGIHYYATYVKFGIGRATYDAAQEIRMRHITREEGVALVHKYDGEVPKKYLKDCIDYMELSEDEFWATLDRYRSPHLWEKVGGEWRLRHKVV